MGELHWQEKAAALDALSDIAILFRKPGDWYVNQHVEIKDAGVLIGTFGNGATPQEAIENHWQELVDNIAGTRKYLVVRAYQDQRRAVRWNGFMWQDVPEPSPATGTKE